MREVFTVSEGVDFVVFTPDEAGAPELHEGPWHFEPVTDYEGCGEVFSQGYPTLEEAKRAATEYALGEYLRLQEAADDVDAAEQEIDDRVELC